MGIMRPATPGFLVTLVATILLTVVSFSVPLFKSVYFLKASLTVENVDGTITFGTLGYCIEIGATTTCSKPSIGYELDINKLVGNKLPIQIPQAVVKWLTYALVLHIVALVLSAIAALFGLLAHVREMAMTCFSSCISGFAATVALFAFIFDLTFFFIAKARFNQVAGGSAQTGLAIWLTLAAWILLFFSGCFYTLGRCCIKRRPTGGSSKWDPPAASGGGLNNNSYQDQMRLDAVKAEADRKARQKQGEGGLPAFTEYQPLKAVIDGDSVYVDEERPYQDHHEVTPGAYGGRPSAQGGYAGGGYVPAAPGAAAVDEYYSPTQTNYGAGYPPRRQNSNHTQASYPYPSSSPAPPVPTNNQYLGTNQYGHMQRDTSYHSAQEYPTNYSSYEPHDPYAPQTQLAAPYGDTRHMSPPPDQNPYYAQSAPQQYTQSPPQQYTQSPPTHYAPPDRSYTLGGDGYGENVVPPLQRNYNEASYGAYPAPINTNNVGNPTGLTSPVRGPRSPRVTSPPPQQHYPDNPPGYDMGTGNIPGAWGKQ